MGFHTGEQLKVDSDRLNGQVVTVTGFDHPKSHAHNVEQRKGRDFCFICWTYTDSVVEVRTQDGRTVVLAEFEVVPFSGVHPTHKVNDPESEQPRGWTESHCSLCSLHVDDEKMVEPCTEEPHFDPYSAPDAWAGGFAENH